MTSPTRETQAEATLIREVLAVTTETNNRHDELMQKWDLLTTNHPGPVVGFALYSKLQSQTLVGRWRSGKKGHRSDTRVRAVFKKISNVSISRRTQRAYPGRLTHLPSIWCFVQQKAGIARPPSDSSWGGQFDNGEDTREILDTSLQKTNKESDKLVRWV